MNASPGICLYVPPVYLMIITSSGHR